MKADEWSTSPRFVHCGADELLAWVPTVHAVSQGLCQRGCCSHMSTVVCGSPLTFHQTSGQFAPIPA